MPDAITKPAVTTKILFWITLGVVSTSFAEVLAGSMPFPLFSATGWIVTIPLYTLHILVLGGWAIKYKPNLHRLYLFGILFGLYEAYITKVLWNPPWETPLSLGGVAVIETIVLILFWHPVVSFIIPLLLIDQVITKTPTLLPTAPHLLAEFLTKNCYRIILFYAVLFGFSHSMGLDSTRSLLAGVSFLGSMWLLVYVWQKILKHNFTLTDLMPQQFQLKFLSVLLLLFYVVTGASLRPEAVPSLQAQIIIWAIYITVILLIILESHRPQIVAEPAILNISRKQIIVAVVLFLVTSAGAPLLGNQVVTIISTVVNWSVSTVAGCIFLYMSARRAFIKPDQSYLT